MKKRILAVLLAVSMLMGTLAVSAAASGQYSDTKGHWAEAAIERWSGYGVVEGHDGVFEPEGVLTRGQMAKVLAEVLGLEKERDNPFSDVPADAWYAPYVLRCYEAGILAGDGQNAKPNDPITREEAMTMLCRALNIAPAQNTDFATFSDGGQVSDWAAPYVAAMVESGIVGGVGNGQLAPNVHINRASLMTILDRSVVQYINEPGTYTLTDKEGIVLVASGDVTLTGKTSADVLVTPAAESKSVTFDKATVTGSVTVQADGAKVKNQNSTLPDIDLTGENSTIEQNKTPVTGGGGGIYIPSHSHSLTKVEAKEATCGDGNTEYWKCSCGKLFADAGGKTETTLEKVTVKGTGEHTWNEGEVTTAPTCTKAGVRTYTCSVCGNTKTESIDATGHTEVDVAAVDPTCTETGLTAGKKCSVCEAVIVAQETIAALGHDFSGSYQKNETGHWHKCSRCDGTDTVAPHAYNNADCSVAGTCTVCAYEKAAGTHVWNRGTVTKPATCTEAGEKTYTCTSCQSTRTEPITATGHKEVTIPAKAPTCTETGLTAGKKCSVCGTVTVAQTEISATGHSWNAGVVTKEPTETAEGVKTYTCTVCNAKKTESIPKVPVKEIWFEIVDGSPIMHWKAVPLTENERYMINYGTESYLPTTQAYYDLRNTLAANLSEVLHLTVYKSTPTSDDLGLTKLYTVEIPLTVTETVINPTISLDGSVYRLQADNAGMGIIYTLNTPDGTDIISGCIDSGEIISGAPYAGCVLRVQTMNGTVSEDRQSLSITKSKIAEISTFPAWPSYEPVTVNDIASLKSALLRGGSVTLGQDIIAGDAHIQIFTGPPAQLNLNGHTLEISVFIVGQGKELTIDGTTANSAIRVTGSADPYGNGSIIYVNKAGKLTINGGSYCAFHFWESRECSLSNITASSDTGNTIFPGNGASVTIHNSYSSSTVGYAVHANSGANVKLENCTIPSSGGNRPMFHSVDEGTKILVVSGTYTANHGIASCYSGGVVSITGGTFKFDPTQYVNTSTHTVTHNGDSTYTVTAK